MVVIRVVDAATSPAFGPVAITPPAVGGGAPQKNGHPSLVENLRAFT